MFKDELLDMMTACYFKRVSISEFFVVTRLLYKLFFTLFRRKGLAKTQHKHM